jgi:hypothetical protein
MVFARHLDNITVTGSHPSIGTWYRQDSFIVTQNLSSTYRDFAKTHANPDTPPAAGQAPGNSIKPPGRYNASKSLPDPGLRKNRFALDNISVIDQN